MNLSSCPMCSQIAAASMIAEIAKATSINAIKRITAQPRISRMQMGDLLQVQAAGDARIKELREARRNALRQLPYGSLIADLISDVIPQD